MKTDWRHAIADRLEYASKLGIITAEWSALEWHLCSLFGKLLGVDTERAEAVFYALTNNRARREIIASLVKVAVPEGDEIRDRVDRILNRSRRAAARRNAIAHNILIFSRDPDDTINLSFDRHSGKLKSEISTIKHLDQIIDQLRELRRDVHILVTEITKR